MQSSQPTHGAQSWAYYGLTGLALSVGWGIRGNFGHEYGAMIPGALAGVAVALLSGRQDWRERVAYFAMFGALGWSFGGSISYMQVIAYTHSGHSPSVLYGFASLFVIGFLWAAPGGVGTALAAVLDRERLTGLFGPMTAVFLVWALQGKVVEPWFYSQGFTLNWFDTDWPGALSAPLAVLALAAIRGGKFDWGTRLILWMSAGWWIGFLLLVNVLGLRMTPPRGDNWAGCLGMTVALLVFLTREDLLEVARAGLVCGFVGGIGFAGASMLKLVEVTCGIDTNWHSILEQTTGLFNGLALAVALAGLVRRGPVLTGETRVRRWTEVYAVGFVLILVTYVNLRKNAAEWVRVQAVPETMGPLPAWAWFDIGYLILTVATLVPLWRHLKRPIALVPRDALGRGQLLFVVFAWWMVVGNFERALVRFTGVRLVTEGVIAFNAMLCTLIVLLWPVTSEGALRQEPSPTEIPRPRLGRVVLVGLAATALAVLVDWGVVRAIYGDRHAGHSNLHIRFGPNATISKPNSPR